MAITLINPKWGAERPIFGVLFDMDGLVLDTEKLYSRFWREACAFYGFSMSYEQSLGMRSLSKTLGPLRLKEYFGDTADYAAIRGKRIELMDAFLEAQGPEVKPGIWALLDALEERGIPAAITSASPGDRIGEHLSRVGLLHRFQAICSGHDVPNGKPAPDIYLLGASRLGVDPRNCLALEDSPTGILSAYRAGCLSVLVPDLDDPTEPLRPNLYAKADSLADIISLL